METLQAEVRRRKVEVEVGAHHGQRRNEPDISHVLIQEPAAIRTTEGGNEGQL